MRAHGHAWPHVWACVGTRRVGARRRARALPYCKPNTKVLTCGHSLFTTHIDTATDTGGAYLLFVRNRSDGADVEAALRC